MEEYELGWADRAERVQLQKIDKDSFHQYMLQELDDEIMASGVSPDNIRKWKVLQSVQDRNETLFYRYDQANKMKREHKYNV